jgi:hypothetical protein
MSDEKQSNTITGAVAQLARELADANAFIRFAETLPDLQLEEVEARYADHIERQILLATQPGRPTEDEGLVCGALRQAPEDPGAAHEIAGALLSERNAVTASDREETAALMVQAALLILKGEA